MLAGARGEVNARQAAILLALFPLGRGKGEGRLSFETTATRLWKRLTREERLAAAAAFWKDTPAEVAGSALGAVVRARKLRPQVARTMAPEERAQALASVLEPGETVAASLLVALHLASRRPMLGAFLDGLGLPHEDGLLKEEAEGQGPPAEDVLAAAAGKLKEGFPANEVATYLNTLWLQDPDRWAGLARLEQ